MKHLSKSLTITVLTLACALFASLVAALWIIKTPVSVPFRPEGGLVNYTVSFDYGLEGGETIGGETEEDELVKSGSEITLPDIADLPREGHRLDYWETSTGVVYAPGASYTVQRDRTFTAHWVDTVTITFDTGTGRSVTEIRLDKGTAVGDFDLAENIWSSTHGEWAEDPAAPSGKKFAGWVDQTYHDPYDETTPIYYDVTLVPKYEMTDTSQLSYFDYALIGGGTNANSYLKNVSGWTVSESGQFEFTKNTEEMATLTIGGRAYPATEYTLSVYLFAGDSFKVIGKQSKYSTADGYAVNWADLDPAGEVDNTWKFAHDGWYLNSASGSDLYLDETDSNNIKVKTSGLYTISFRAFGTASGGIPAGQGVTGQSISWTVDKSATYPKDHEIYIRSSRNNWLDDYDWFAGSAGVPKETPYRMELSSSASANPLKFTYRTTVTAADLKAGGGAVQFKAYDHLTHLWYGEQSTVGAYAANKDNVEITQAGAYEVAFTLYTAALGSHSAGDYSLTFSKIPEYTVSFDLGQDPSGNTPELEAPQQRKLLEGETLRLPMPDIWELHEFGGWRVTIGAQDFGVVNSTLELTPEMLNALKSTPTIKLTAEWQFTLTGLEVTPAEDELVFTAGETFTHAGVKVTAHYSDPTADRDVTKEATIALAPDTDMATAGEKKVLVTFEDGSTEYTIYVLPAATVDVVEGFNQGESEAELTVYVENWNAPDAGNRQNRSSVSWLFFEHIGGSGHALVKLETQMTEWATAFTPEEGRDVTVGHDGTGDAEFGDYLEIKRGADTFRIAAADWHWALLGWEIESIELSLPSNPETDENNESAWKESFALARAVGFYAADGESENVPLFECSVNWAETSGVGVHEATVVYRHSAGKEVTATFDYCVIPAVDWGTHRAVFEGAPFGTEFSALVRDSAHIDETSVAGSTTGWLWKRTPQANNLCEYELVEFTYKFDLYGDPMHAFEAEGFTFELDESGKLTIREDATGESFTCEKAVWQPVICGKVLDFADINVKKGDETECDGEWIYWYDEGSSGSVVTVQRTWRTDRGEEGTDLDVRFHTESGYCDYGYQLFYNDSGRFPNGTPVRVTFTLKATTDVSGHLDGNDRVFDVKAGGSQTFDFVMNVNYTGDYEGSSLFAFVVHAFGGTDCAFTITDLKFAIVEDPTFTFAVSGDPDDVKLTISGKVDPMYAGKTADIDYELSSVSGERHPFYGEVGPDGSFEVVLNMPDLPFDVNIYLHLTIVESAGGETVWKNGEWGNFGVEWCKNADLTEEPVTGGAADAQQTLNRWLKLENDVKLFYVGLDDNGLVAFCKHVPQELEATDADLEADGGRVYFVVKGTCAGYNEQLLREAFAYSQGLGAFRQEDRDLGRIGFDLQQRGEPWTRYIMTPAQVSVEGGAFTLKFDVTDMDVHETPHTAHFGKIVENSDNHEYTPTDLKLAAEHAEDGKSVAINGKTYTLVNKYGSGLEEENWGCVSLKVEDTAALPAPNHTFTVEIGADKPALTFEGHVDAAYANYYVCIDHQIGDVMEYFYAQIGEEGGYTLEMDLSEVDAVGKNIFFHFAIVRSAAEPTEGNLVCRNTDENGDLLESECQNAFTDGYIACVGGMSLLKYTRKGYENDAKVFYFGINNWDSKFVGYCADESQNFEYIITFQTEHGSKDPMTVTLATADANPFGELTDPGYEFLGWYYEGERYEKLTPALIEAAGGASKIPLTASWQIRTFEVTFKSAHGTPPSPLQREYNTELSLDEYTIDDTDTQYFAGWALSTEPEVAVHTVTVTSAITLQAIWKAKTVVRFYFDSTSSAMSGYPQYLKPGERVTAPASPSAKTGYTVDTWYTNSGYTAKATLPHTVAEGETTLNYYGRYKLTLDARDYYLSGLGGGSLATVNWDASLKFTRTAGTNTYTLTNVMLVEGDEFKIRFNASTWNTGSSQYNFTATQLYSADSTVSTYISTGDNAQVKQGQGGIYTITLTTICPNTTGTANTSTTAGNANQIVSLKFTRTATSKSGYWIAGSMTNWTNARCAPIFVGASASGTVYVEVKSGEYGDGGQAGEFKLVYGTYSFSSAAFTSGPTYYGDSNYWLTGSGGNIGTFRVTISGTTTWSHTKV